MSTDDKDQPEAEQPKKKGFWSWLGFGGGKDDTPAEADSTPSEPLEEPTPAEAQPDPAAVAPDDERPRDPNAPFSSLMFPEPEAKTPAPEDETPPETDSADPAAETVTDAPESEAPHTDAPAQDAIETEHHENIVSVETALVADTPALDPQPEPVDESSAEAQAPPADHPEPETPAAPDLSALNPAPVDETPDRACDSAVETGIDAEPDTQTEPDAEIDAEPETAADAEAEAEAEDEAPKPGFFARLRAGLSRSTSAISEGITSIFTKAKLDDATLEDLEDLLITSDLGVEVAGEVTRDLSKNRFNKDISPGEVRQELARIVAARMEPVAKDFRLQPGRLPHVVLVVGVNGTGKTTTIGKLAHRFRQDGKTVMLAAGDTFRAAAIEQLKIWGERTDSPVMARDVGADAAGLAFDALKAAREEACDVLMIDTAGRLQNKQGLMEELAKITRVLKKQDPEAPHSVLLVLDATTGQNAISQVEVFKDVAGVTGLVMTKLDGTARGGILVSLAAKFGLPIHAIGVGEGIEDFQPFDPQEFADALTGATQDKDTA